MESAFPVKHETSSGFLFATINKLPNKAPDLYIYLSAKDSLCQTNPIN